MKKGILKAVFVLATMLGCFGTSMSQEAEQVVDNVVFNRNGANVSMLSVLLPLPQTNMYQTVVQTDYGDGTLCNIAESSDKYVRFQRTNVSENTLTFGITTKLIHHEVHIDFAQVDDDVPYDTSSIEYQRHTGATTEGSVAPGNAIITNVGDSLWALSSGIVDYAQRCYDYVAQNFSYLNPNTGIHPVSQVLAAGGGDCGNLSSIFVSLLRHKGIPSRHVVSYFSNGGTHVWAEFMIQDFGWIPVDVTYHMSDPTGNYFGHNDYNAVVVGFDVDALYSRWNSNDTYRTPLLQTYQWWFWGNGNPSTTWQVSGSPIDVVFHLQATSNNTDRGMVLGGGYYTAFDTATLYAVPKADILFKGWNDGETANPRRVAMDGDVAIEALFSEQDTVIVHDTIYITTEDINMPTEQSIKVYSEDGFLVVDGYFDGMVILYDLTGRKLEEQQGRHSPLRFHVPASGAYLIKSGDGITRKIVLSR